MQNNVAEEKLGSLLKFGSKLGLERMEVLMDMLGNPQDKINVVHVAGTNGKGSTCRFLSSILRESGYMTGLFTSPALTDFRERIEIDGELISEEDLNAVSQRVFENIEIMKRRGHDSPTEFEAVTAIAYTYFYEKRVDVAIMEVGLGGRGDSTNIVKNPMVCAITSIDFDHVDRLGSRLGEIAYEKAGIIKKNVPVVVNLIGEEARAVIEKVCETETARLVDISKEPIKIISSNLEGTIFELSKMPVRYKISMLGRYQAENAKTAIKICEILNEQNFNIRISREDMENGLEKAFNKGRFELCSKDPMVVIDGAHNAAGGRALAESVANYFPGEKILAIIGVLGDKDVESLIKNIADVADGFIVTEPDNDRRLSVEDLQRTVSKYGKYVMAEKIPKNAYVSAVRMVEQGEFDVVLVCGSLYLIGEIREMIL